MQGDKNAALVNDQPEPEVRPDYVLVEVKAVALNPTDWKHIDFLNTPGSIIGCDYAGVVVDVGPDCVRSFKKGDKVCGIVHGGNSRTLDAGGFAEKIRARSGLTMMIPDGMSFEEASTMGVAIATCGQGLYQQMQLATPSNPTKNGEFLFIYGGSSAMGTMGIRLGQLSGYRVITTCSPNNFDLVKSYGAETAFNYKDPEAVEQIQKYTNNDLRLIWDTIALQTTAEFCSKILAKGGRYGKILNVDMPDRPDVKQTYSLGYTAAGEPFEMMGTEFKEEVVKPDYEYIQKWMPIGEQLLAQKKVKAHPTKVGKGFENILEAVDLLRNEKVSGQKMVFSVA